MLRLQLDLVLACAGDGVPARKHWVRWGRAALADAGGTVALGVRIVGESEGAWLNERFRGRAGPTNVLSFPYDEPPRGKSRFLGDIVLCAPVVRNEAAAAGRPEDAHWAHLLIHGILHLEGFDHDTDQDARLMETRETRILAGLGFPDPYR